MLAVRAPRKRQINSFKKPFDIDHTPYKLTDFHNLVKEFCKNVKNEWKLKIAKAIFIGDIGVGKTSLINRANEDGSSSFRFPQKREELFINSLWPVFREKTFLKGGQSTIGVDCFLEGFDVLGTPFNIQVWDTAGQERFMSVASSYFHGTTVVGLVFDLSRVDTLYHSEQWLEAALSASNSNQPPCILLIGNKLDDISPSTFEEIKQAAVQLARKLGAEYWVVSSKTGKNVEHLFQRIAVLAFESLVMKEINSKVYKEEAVKLNEKFLEVDKKSCAC